MKEDRISLLVNAEQGLANFTLFLFLVDEFIEGVEVGRSCTIDVVPPIANEVLLVENGSIGAQKGIKVTIRLAHVKDLK